ncbi:MAG TPA: phosphoribosylformylglycinamidine synthase subunit PurQ [Gemmatimonadales bacterium]|nr:phosphoribosylformylglycinamidine synthase subunit PurQ [Gemmatimonadales bacterium]
MRRVAVVRFPGSNCEQDVFHAVERAGADAFYVWHRDTTLGGADAVMLPGGFSYGDYLRAGAIARFSPVMTAVQAFAREGGPVLGICNGFQILCEAGLLPGALLRNAGLAFTSRPVRCRVEQTGTPFTSAYEPGAIVRMPVANGEGRYAADPATLDRLEAEGRVVLRYLDNPNGSVRDIAGIANEGGTVVGIMPHPDRADHSLLGAAEGAGFFTSLAAAPAGAR